MASYYVNKNAQPNGDHEVHVEGCLRMPLPHNRQHLGNFTSCHDAVRAAKIYFHQSNGCYYCCNPCHTS